MRNAKTISSCREIVSADNYADLVKGCVVDRSGGRLQRFIGRRFAVKQNTAKKQKNKKKTKNAKHEDNFEFQGNGSL